MRYILIAFLLNSAFAADYFYPTSYEEARQSFREKSLELQKNNPEVVIGKFQVESQIDPDLTTDYLYLPAKSKSEKLIVFTSGVHGVEAYTGSAMQHLILNEMLEGIDRSKVGLLFVHAINPYGFKFGRRVSENNVDLNRSFIMNRASFKDTNTAYATFDSFLNPEKKASGGFISKSIHFASSAYKVARHGMTKLRQAVLQGQYSFPKGIFFGGVAPEPQQSKVEKLLTEKSLNYNSVFLIDFHTGYGERGTLHFFGVPKYDPRVKKAMAFIFEGQKIDTGSDEDFYTVMGDFTDFVPQLLKSKLVIPITFEYGTLDSQTTSGSIESLRRTKLENQGHHHGYKTEKAEKRVKSLFLDMFNPGQKKWRDKVISTSRRLFPLFFTRYSELVL